MPIALVTGSSTGIGLATAVALARGGLTVYASMRNLGGSKELQQITAAEKLPIKLLQLDVDDDGSVRNGVAKIFADEGCIDVLVNNAGIAWLGSVEELPLADFRQVLETNFFGALRCIQAVVPGMRKQRSGCIINVTSVAGRIAIAPQAAYAASKWALEALSEVLAQEVKTYGIRVAIVEPGVIQTPIFTKEKPKQPSQWYPHERRLQAIFAASLQNPVSPYVVGERILEIVNSKSNQLRYPVGPDAAPLIQWRAGMTDEQWVARGAASDADWTASVKREFNLDVKL